MPVLKIFFYIIVFLLCLSFVVCIHELGHLIVAKICKVYCFEYSIGFGPKIFSKKIKHKKKIYQDGKPLFQARNDGKQVPLYEKVEGETYVSLRALPLGGYVAMAGEDGNQSEDGKIIPKERCLNGVNHFKQICIMLAGITMNFILAWVLFFASALLPLTTYDTSKAIVTVNDYSYAYNAGLRTSDQILYLYQEYVGLVDEEGSVSDSVYFPSTKEETQINSYQSYKDGADTNNLTYDDFSSDCLSYAILDVYEVVNQNLLKKPEQFNGLRSTSSSKRIIHFMTNNSNNEWLSAEIPSIEERVTIDKVELKYWGFDVFGITATKKTVQYSFGKAFTYSFKEFGTLFVSLYTSLGMLFTPSGWKNVGGIISVYKVSTAGLTSGSLAYFLMLWGYISLNLGCFNLLPLPGLDGWQTLIALIETCTRKKLPTKFKNVANTIGLVIMLILAGLLVIKDLIV